MAIIIDPDDLDRNQIVFGTENQRISLYPVGAVVTGAYDPERYTGQTPAGGGAGTGTFRDTVLGGFNAHGIAAGNIVSIKTGEDAGHYVVLARNSDTELVLALPDGQAVWVDTAMVSGTYDIRNAAGGSIVDGVSEQAVYSFGKEEWRSDSQAFGGDNLIRHQFPWEPITREQFEIGGGTSHGLWDWFRNDTRERVRTGGWAIVTGTTTSYRYAGIVTLGSLDNDTQVYYQQSGTHANPANFVLEGPVNQAVGVFNSTGLDNRTFLKLFARKKARSYSQSEIADIGVTTLEAIVNRFPLTHSVDPAIDAADAEILGNDPWTNSSVPDTGASGVTADIDGDTGSLTAAGENFDVSGIAVGDVVEITGGINDNGFFEILQIQSASVLILDTTEAGAFSGESSLTYQTHRRRIINERSNDGTAADVDFDTGTLTSVLGGFSGTVAANDILRITEAGSLRGVYRVVSQDSDTQLTLNTVDQNFTGTPLTTLDYEVLEPGMYLQYKKVTVGLGSLGNLTFNENSPSPDTIARSAGSWGGDGLTPGDVITVAGSVSNNGDYTAAWVSGSVVGLVATDDVVQEGPVAATATAESNFKRTINDVIYAFRWRLFGNQALASPIFEFVQRELRRTSNIDNGPGGANRPWDRGDVTDLLMTFASPTAQGLDLYIDQLDPNDANNVSFLDATDVARAPSFIAAGSIAFNANLSNDPNAVYVMFFADPDATPGSGDEFGTPGAIIVNDASGDPIQGNVTGASSVTFDFDYDGNIQGGRTPATDADVVIVAIGLSAAQYVRFDGTITRATGLSFSLVSALERNYSNP